jgi:flagellar hook protein FlgE
MSFEQGLSGLNAASRDLDVIGNNVANANTVGFKGSQADFADVYANSLAAAGGAAVGIGTSVAAVQQGFTQGNISVSSNPLDVAINGQGFFRLSDDGVVSYSRNGQFHLDKSGYIINANGAHLTGYGVNANGVLATANPDDLQVSTAELAPKLTTQGSIVANLDSRDQPLPAAGFDINDPSSYDNATSMTVYDSLGNAHTLSSYFVKTADDTWSVFGASDGTQLGTGALGTLKFTSSGAIDTAATTLPLSVSMPLANGAATPLALSLDFTGSTQFGSVFGVSTLDQDGYASGQLAGFAIADDGTVQGRYSNGQSRTLGQMVLANFANPQGLQPLGNNAWGETSASGQPLIGSPGSGTLGQVQSGALEDSNIDLTAQLVDMITAQRSYQANAQTIKTQDAVMQTLVNLR